MHQQMIQNVEEEDDFNEVETTFGFCDPKISDALTLSAFIPRFVPLNRLEVARAVCHQTKVGTVVKDQDEEGNPGDSTFGFVSVLNLGLFVDVLPSIGKFVEWMKKLGDMSLNDILENHINTTGLILNERALGVPHELAPHLMRGLFNEIAWATEDLEKEEDRESFRFTHYIMVKKFTKSEEGFEFVNIEDELFFKNAPIKVEFETEGEDGDLEGVEYHRMIWAFDINTPNIVRQELNAMYGVDESQYAYEHQK